MAQVSSHRCSTCSPAAAGPAGGSSRQHQLWPPLPGLCPHHGCEVSPAWLRLPAEARHVQTCGGGLAARDLGHLHLCHSVCGCRSLAHSSTTISSQAAVLSSMAGCPGAPVLTAQTTDPPTPTPMQG